MLIDTHAHLDFPEFADLAAVLDRAEKAGVREIVTIGINLDSSREAIRLAQLYPRIYAAVGIHPHDAFALDEETLSTVRDLCREPRVLAIGEIGLDYYRNYMPQEIQRECFEHQLEIAAALGLPVVFHIREAFDDFFDIVGGRASSLDGGILHCFSGDWAVAKKCLDLGFYLSIPGTVTFTKADTLRDVAGRAPIDRLLLETDAPYLAPVPYRGKVNEPAFVYHTALKVAQLRGCSLEDLAAATTANAHRVFRIDDRLGRAETR